MRNIVYLLFILVFSIIGIGIMLRLHIDPRTVMTVQNQIPKIIIGIVTITFSFALAGFLVDIMWVVLYLFASVIASATSGVLSPNVVSGITQANSPFDAANLVYPGEVGIIDLSGAVAGAFAQIINSALAFITDDLGIIRDAIVGIINVLAFIIILIAILVALIRLLVVLIFAYINIILDVIFAPWWILLGYFPVDHWGLGHGLGTCLQILLYFPFRLHSLCWEAI